MSLRIISACFCLLGLSPFLSVAQHRVTPNDERVIKRKALSLMEDLVGKYNQLLDSDSEDRNIIIENMVLPDEENMSVFQDDQVYVEDDFYTRELNSSEALTKKVDVYLKDLCFNFGREDNGKYPNEGKMIRFTNLITSKLMAATPSSPVFIKVYFQVRYNGIDKRTGLPYKDNQRRTAELKVEKKNNVWFITIITLRAFKEDEADFSANVIVDATTKGVAQKPDETGEKGRSILFKAKNPDKKGTTNRIVPKLVTDDKSAYDGPAGFKTIQFLSDPKSVSIYNGDTYLGQTPVNLQLPYGNVNLEFRKDQHDSKAYDMTIRENSVDRFSTELRMSLDPYVKKKRTNAIATTATLGVLSLGASALANVRRNKLDEFDLYEDPTFITSTVVSVLYGFGATAGLVRTLTISKKRIQAKREKQDKKIESRLTFNPLYEGGMVGLRMDF